jgi:hypothetical protein
LKAKEMRMERLRSEEVIGGKGDRGSKGDKWKHGKE